MARIPYPQSQGRQADFGQPPEPQVEHDLVAEVLGVQGAHSKSSSQNPAASEQPYRRLPYLPVVEATAKDDAWPEAPSLLLPVLVQ